MENAIISRYMKMLAPLSTELKLEIIKKLTDSLKLDFSPKEIDSEKNDLLEKLGGAWKDSDDILIDDIYNSRSMSF